jgi:hypothetical protein
LKGWVRIVSLCLVTFVFAHPCSSQTNSTKQVVSERIPGLITVQANVPVAPPGWAVLERQLIAAVSEAALKYTEIYTRSGGTLLWKTDGSASADDLFESFYNFPLLYALGGDEKLLELSFKQWSAMARQLTYDFDVLHREFPKHADWFHISEGWLFFYFLGLADPTDYETTALQGSISTRVPKHQTTIPT